MSVKPRVSCEFIKLVTGEEEEEEDKQEEEGEEAMTPSLPRKAGIPLSIV